VIDGACPRDRVIRIVFGQPLGEAQAGPALFTHRAIQWIGEPLPAAGARRFK